MSKLVARPCQAIRDKVGEVREALTWLARVAPQHGDRILSAVHTLTEITCRVTEIEVDIAAMRMAGALPVKVETPQAEDPNQLLLHLPRVPMLPVHNGGSLTTSVTGKLAAAHDDTFTSEDAA
jgi:hypothetical protein